MFNESHLYRALCNENINRHSPAGLPLSAYPFGLPPVVRLQPPRAAFQAISTHGAGHPKGITGELSLDCQFCRRHNHRAEYKWGIPVYTPGKRA